MSKRSVKLWKIDETDRKSLRLNGWNIAKAFWRLPVGGDKASCPKTLSTMRAELWMWWDCSPQSAIYIFVFPCLIASKTNLLHHQRWKHIGTNNHSHEPACLWGGSGHFGLTGKDLWVVGGLALMTLAMGAVHLYICKQSIKIDMIASYELKSLQKHISDLIRMWVIRAILKIKSGNTTV